MKKLLGSRKENISVVIGALVIALGIFYVVHNPNLFMTSVLSLQEQELIAQKGRDLAYKTQSGVVDIFLAPDKQTPVTLDITLSFGDQIILNTKNLSGQGLFDIQSQEANSITFKLSQITDVEKNQSLFLVPFSGKYTDILVSESQGTYPDGSSKSLSIGNLNVNSSHSK